MSESLKVSLVRIRTVRGNVVGVGFLVGERQVLTCAHIIIQALDLVNAEEPPPLSTVILDFPFLAPHFPLVANVTQWCPEQQDDIAGLELLVAPPLGAAAVRFAQAADVWYHPFSTLGFPTGNDDGIWATGRLLGRQAANWIQLEDVKTEGSAVIEGFSGAPIWDEQLQGVVGMVVTTSLRRETKTAFAIPFDVLMSSWPLMEPVTSPRVFLSSAPLDAAFAERLRTDLLARGMVVWNDQHGPIDPTTNPPQRKHQAIRAAQAVVLVVSPHTWSSHIVKEHLYMAHLYERLLILVRTSYDAQVPRTLLDGQKTVWVDGRTASPETMLTAIETHLAQISMFPKQLDALEIAPCNPYKGLQAFTASDEQYFFGRDRLVNELVEDMATILATEPSAADYGRLLAIIGPSGSGKSSVVMAGLLPRLQRGALPESESWVYLQPIVPGEHPIEALFQTLTPHFPDISFKTLRENLNDDTSDGLHMLTKRLAHKPGTRVVLLIDQFEELFTLTVSENERRQFIELLLTAATAPAAVLLVLLTLRADFYDRPMDYPPLSRLLQTHQRQVLPMEVEDLRATIEQPAALPDVQLSFEGNLVGDLLYAMQGQIGALPLLQFTLYQLFERRSGHLCTLQAYRDIGGVKGALSQHAEKTYEELPSDEHRHLARLLFPRLIELGASELDTTRRRVEQKDFDLPDAMQTQQMQETLETFTRARLLTTTQINGTATFEVSHEALIREWKRLADWLHEARGDIALQQTISKAATEWEQRGQQKDRLYHGSQLKEANKWAEHNLPSKKEAAFLRTSIAYQTQSRFRVTAIVIVFALLLVLTTGLAFVLPRQTITKRVDVTRVVNATQVVTKIVNATNFTHVVTLADDGPGSLRGAIASASDGTTITFDASLKGKIELASTLLITRRVTLRGPGADILAVGGNDVKVATSGVSISGLAFGSVTNSGTLTMTNCIISASKANDTHIGGGLTNTGTLTLINSTVSDSSRYRGSAMGVNISSGGGIYNSGTLTLINSTVSGNYAPFGGGGIANGGTLTLMNSTISGNSALLDGGGIDNRGTLSLTNSIVSGNSAPWGGGIYNGTRGTFSLINSTISGNSAGGGSDYGGGGIYNSTLATLSLINSTISGNSVSKGSNGGGIFNQNGKADITFCIIYGNTASNGGGVSIQDDRLVQNSPSQVVIRNSIIAGNHAGTGPDISGKLTSDGYNLIQDVSGATFVDPLRMHSTDLTGNTLTTVGIDPVLRKNGGPTQTLALLPGSPAIDQIPLDACHITINGTLISTDQRGVKRPQENRCDIGAYEYVPPS